MTPRKWKKTPWELIDEAASRALTRTGDIGRKGLTDVIAAGIALERVVTYLAAHKAEHLGGFKGWCNSKNVCVKTCDRYRALAAAWQQAEERSKSGEPEAVDLLRRLTDEAVTPTVVAAERLLGLREVKTDVIPRALTEHEPEAAERNAVLSAKDRVIQFANKVDDIVTAMGLLELELYAYRIIPDDIAPPLERLIREANALRAQRPQAGPGRGKSAANVEELGKALAGKETDPDRRPAKSSPSRHRRGRPQGELIFDAEGE